jgi:hypothetical protein
MKPSDEYNMMMDGGGLHRTPETSCAPMACHAAGRKKVTISRSSSLGIKYKKYQGRQKMQEKTKTPNPKG